MQSGLAARLLCRRIDAGMAALSSSADDVLTSRMPQLLRLEEAMGACLGSVPLSEEKTLTHSGLLSGKPQIASYIIDKTFDDHKTLLRTRLDEALNEIERLRSGSKLLEAEEALAQSKAATELALRDQQTLAAALEQCQHERREALVNARVAQRTFLGWHQAILMRLIATFTVCEEWRDWQFEAFLGTSLPLPMKLVTDVEKPQSTKSVPTPPSHHPYSLPSIRSKRTSPLPVANVPRPVPYGEGSSTITKAIIHPRREEDKKKITPKGTGPGVVVARLGK